jgi:cystathionine beta-synthase
MSSDLGAPGSEMSFAVPIDVTETIGATPLVWLATVGPKKIFIKLEKMNPTQSAKDRMALAIIQGAEKRGDLAAGGTIVESSSGNTATALAMIAAARGYKCIAVMDRHATPEKVETVRAYGAEVVLVGGDAAEGVVAAAERQEEVRRILGRIPGAFFADQADNPDNARAFVTLADEVIEAVGTIDILIGAVGSGGSLCGTSRELRRRGQCTRVIAVEPAGSITFGGHGGPYLQSGPGTPPGIAVAANVDFGVIDEHVGVTDREAFNTARALARTKGLLLGGSSGAAVYVALTLACTDQQEANVVVIAADGGEKYLSTIFNDAWMSAHNLVNNTLMEHLNRLLARNSQHEVARP